MLFGHYYLDKGVSESRRSGETESERTAMPNIIDYSSEEMRTFARKPFCSADSLILSFLSYVDMPKSIPVLSARKPHEKSEYRPSGKPPAKPSDFVSSPRAALNMVSRYLFGNDKIETEFKCARPAVMSELLRAEEFASMFNSYKNESQAMRELVFNLAASARFREIKIGCFAKSEDYETDDISKVKQFAAYTAFLPDETVYIAFRGTDTSIAGWKEDFNLSFQCPVPSQTSAAKYLSAVASLFPDKKIMLGGHSKGGNLAVYAAAVSDERIQRRIEKIYSHDGPGLPDELCSTESYERIAGKIHKTVPEESVVGMIMDKPENCRVIKSAGHNINQHFAKSWQIQNGGFMVGQLSNGSRVFCEAISDFMRKVDKRTREQFLKTVYLLLDSTGYSDIPSLAKNWYQSVSAISAALKNVEAKDRELMSGVMKAFAQAAFQQVSSPSFRTGKEQA